MFSSRMLAKKRSVGLHDSIICGGEVEEDVVEGSSEGAEAGEQVLEGEVGTWPLGLPSLREQANNPTVTSNQTRSWGMGLGGRGVGGSQT